LCWSVSRPDAEPATALFPPQDRDYRRGLWQVPVVLNISDSGTWIDPLSELHKLVDVRILDLHHADERLFEVARALKGNEDHEYHDFADVHGSFSIGSAVVSVASGSGSTFAGGQGWSFVAL